MNPLGDAVMVTGLSKCYGETEVLRDVSLRFEPARVSSLLGASGSGKTTLLRCMMGLEVFEHGRVSVGGLTLDAGVHVAQRRALQQRAGLVFQQWHLFPHMTALENVIDRKSVV